MLIRRRWDEEKKEEEKEKFVSQYITEESQKNISQW